MEQSETGARPAGAIRERSIADLTLGLCLFAFQLFLYWYTLTPGLPYGVDGLNPPGDTHEFTMAIADLRLTRRTGYPIYTWLGFLFTRLVPFGELAYRTNLLSAVFGAGAVTMLFVVMRGQGLRTIAALFASLAFGVTTTFWSQAVITEVYTSNVLALTVVLWSLLRWARKPSTKRFTTFALAYGVSLGFHTSNLSLAPVFALFVLATDRRILRDAKTLALGSFAFLVGLSQYLWLPLMADTAPFPNISPDTPMRFYKYTIGAFSNLRFAYPVEALPRRFLYYLSLLHLNYGFIGIALGATGAWFLVRRRPTIFWLFFGAFAMNVFLAMQVYATDTEVFFLPSYVAWAVFVGVGIDGLWSALSEATSRQVSGPGRFTRLVPALFVLVLGCWGLLLARASFVANDRSSDTIMPDFYEAVFAVLPPNSYLAAGPGVFGQAAAYYQKIQGLRPDVTIYDEPRRMKMPPQPVYTTLVPKDGRVIVPFGPSPFPPNAWLIPVLNGNYRDLILYRIDKYPPKLAAEGVVPATPRRRSQEPTELVSFAVSVLEEPPRPRLRIRLLWRIGQLAQAVVTKLDDEVIEDHSFGMRNLKRYVDEVGFFKDDLMQENYELVLPRSIKAGRHNLQFGLRRLGSDGFRTVWSAPREITIGLPQGHPEESTDSNGSQTSSSGTKTL